MEKEIKQVVEIYNSGQKKYMLYQKNVNYFFISNLDTCALNYISYEELLLDLENKYGFMDTIFKSDEVKKAFNESYGAKTLEWDCVHCKKVAFIMVSGMPIEYSYYYKIKWSAKQLRGE